jgi:hypothetical protein
VYLGVSVGTDAAPTRTPFPASVTAGISAIPWGRLGRAGRVG